MSSFYMVVNSEQANSEQGIKNVLLLLLQAVLLYWELKFGLLFTIMAS